MELYSENQHYKLYHGNMLDMGKVIEIGTIDSIVTDPPYELNFMLKGWDNSGIAFQPDTWKRCLDALKPGGYLLAFGGSRTFYRIACAIEDAGFEIRDTIMWLYGSGFPKSLNIGLAIDKKNGVDNRTGNIKSDGVGSDSGSGCYNMNNGESNMKSVYEERKATNKRAGWGTALKPSYEPIIVARKPLEGSCTDNVIKYGVGGINIDECRVAFNGDKWKNQKSGNTAKAFNLNEQQREAGTGVLAGYECEANDNSRFPANTILTYDESDFEEVCSGFPITKGTKQIVSNKGSIWNSGNEDKGEAGFNDEGSAARYFYCAKASKRDRDEGLPEGEHSTHPTVKPCDLMQYLVRLVTPNGGTVLDPFNGSGSTGKAVMYENKDRNKNYKYIGIELTEEYLPIAKARIEYVINKGTEIEKSDPKQEEEVKQRKESALF